MAQPLNRDRLRKPVAGALPPAFGTKSFSEGEKEIYRAQREKEEDNERERRKDDANELGSSWSSSL